MKSLLRLLTGRAGSAAKPEVPEIDRLITTGQKLEDEGHPDRALEHYRRALALDPQSAIVHLNYGNALSSLGNQAGALDSFKRAVALDPGNASARLNLGNALLATDNLSLAEQSYRAALQIRPDWVPAQAGLACVLEELGAHEQAAAAYRHALTLDAGHAGVAYNLSALLMQMGRGEEARQILRDCLQQAKDNLGLLQKLSDVDLNAGNIEKGIAMLDEIIRLAPDYAYGQSIRLMALNYHPKLDAHAIREAHTQFGRALEARIPADRLEPRAVLTGRPLRIGYVSPDFRQHAVAHFLFPLLRNHDRDAFEVLAYPVGGAPQDAVTEQFKALTDGWREDPRSLWNDESLAATIQKDRIDVLVDLAGHTAGNMITLFARKPAPVQISWLGYPESTGLSRMDFRVCDAVTDPAGAGGDLAEGLLHMPDTQWCYQALFELPPPGPLPRLARGYWTFASFNNSRKVNDQALQTWAKVLHAFPDSRLRLYRMLTPDTEAWALRVLTGCGIARERIQLVRSLGTHEYFASFREADIALDSFPYNGTTTTCETLLMGLPILGIKGQRAVSRVGESLLGSMGLSDWIADSAQDLVALAQQQLQNPERIAQLRTELPARMRSGVLMDPVRFTRNFEAQLLRAWNARQS